MTSSGVSRRQVGPDETAHANRSWWDAEAVDYHGEHGAFLGAADFVWGPEGLREADVQYLGATADLRGLTVLEVGSGAAMCGRWLAAQGCRVIASDLSIGMLEQSADDNGRLPDGVALIQADAQRLPIASGSVDLAVSSYGAIPFVADPAGVMVEVARTLRPGGRWVFATTHPMRWMFLDDGGPEGLTVVQSYFDRRPYVEQNDEGIATYVEHHRTMGDRIRDIVAAGLVLQDVIEPEWPETTTSDWGPWSALRGAKMPGTAIFVTRKPF